MVSQTRYGTYNPEVLETESTVHRQYRRNRKLLIYAGTLGLNDSIELTAMELNQCVKDAEKRQKNSRK